MIRTELFIENSQNIKSISDFCTHKTLANNNIFICLIGEYNSYVTDVLDMDNKLRVSSAYKRLSALPPLPPDKVREYDEKYNNWLSNFKPKSAPLQTTIYNEKSSDILSEALMQTIIVFRKSRKQITESIEKNFAIKLLFWYDYVVGDLMNNSYISNGIKVVGENISKVQEFLFYYLLALSGADVLLLQNKTDLDTQLINLKLCARVVLGHLGNKDIPKFTSIHTESHSQPRRNTPTVVQSVPSAPVPNFRQAPQRPSSGNIRVSIPPRPNRQSSGYQQPQQTTPPRNNVYQQPRNNAYRMPHNNNNNNNPRVTIPPRPDRQGSVYVSTPNQQNFPYQFQSQGTFYNPYPGAYPQRVEKSYEELAQLACSVVQILGIHRQSYSSDKFQILGSGSGIMISSSGYILTNNHVAKVSREYAIRVENDDNIYFTNRLIKYHTDYDLAVIQIDRKLSPLPIYKGQKPLVRGQKVVAIGSPKGMFNTVSDGIISGFRTIDLVDMIQFTAPISSGSSGGAILNMYGELIGISTSGIGEGQNINFAVDYKTILNFTRGMTGIY